MCASKKSVEWYKLLSCRIRASTGEVTITISLCENKNYYLQCPSSCVVSPAVVYKGYFNSLQGIFSYIAAPTSSVSGSGAPTPVSGSGAGSAVTQGMEQSLVLHK